MSDADETEWLSVEEAAELLGVSTRQAHRYGELDRIRTEVRRRKTFFWRPSVEDLAAELSRARRPRPSTRPQMIPAGALSDVLRERDRLLGEQQQRLEAALLEVGRLRAEVERRALPGDVDELRAELASVRAERDMLRLQMGQQGGRWRQVAIVGAVLLGLVAVLVIALVLLALR